MTYDEMHLNQTVESVTERVSYLNSSILANIKALGLGSSNECNLMPTYCVSVKW